MSTTWNISYLKTGGNPASSWSDCDLCLPGLSKMSSQHITCRNQRQNLYRHAQSNKYFQGMRICALQYGRKKRNVMLCSQSPKEILKQCGWQTAALYWSLGNKEARLSPLLLAMLPWEIQLTSLCFSVFWPSLIKTIEIHCKNALCWVLPLSVWGNNTGVHSGCASWLLFPVSVSSPGYPLQAA